MEGKRRTSDEGIETEHIGDLLEGAENDLRGALILMKTHSDEMSKNPYANVAFLLQESIKRHLIALLVSKGVVLKSQPLFQVLLNKSMENGLMVNPLSLEWQAVNRKRYPEDHAVLPPNYSKRDIDAFFRITDEVKSNVYALIEAG